MTESKFKKQVCKLARELHGAKVIHVMASMMQEAGLPDTIFWSSKWQGFVEFKGVYTAIQPLQIQRIKALNKRREGSAFIARLTANGTITLTYVTESKSECKLLDDWDIIKGICEFFD